MASSVFSCVLGFHVKADIYVEWMQMMMVHDTGRLIHTWDEAGVLISPYHAGTTGLSRQVKDQTFLHHYAPGRGYFGYEIWSI